MAGNFRGIKFALASMVAALTFAVASPTWAVGSNATTPASTPATPTPVITNTPQLTAVNAGGCTERYTDKFNSLNLSSLIANDVGLGANAVGAAAAVVGLAANLTGTIADGVAQGAITAAWATGATAQVIGATALGIGAAAMATAVTVVATPASVVGGGVGMLAGGVATAATGVAMGVASASTAVQVIATGAKIFALAAEGVGVAANVTGVASQIAATVFDHQSQDLTVYVDTLPECNTTFTGTVTVSGGGLDVTGTSIFNDDVGVAGNVNVEDNVNASQMHATQGISAVGGGIWIGDPNGTTFSSGITVGGGALSGAGFGATQAFTGNVNAIAIGNNANALLSGSLALGLNTNSTAADAIAIGTAATANGIQDVVIGALNNTAAGGNNTVVGNEIDIIGAASADNTVLGVGHQVTGSGNFVGGDPITVVGSNNVAVGNNGTVNGNSNVAIGDTVNVTANNAIVIGDNTTATADNTTVVGTNAQANATGSAAFGQGAVATQTNQVVIGTATNTYTTPGITSNLSKARQTGPLEITTTDTFGNLATDGGTLFDSLSKNQAGIAIAMAMVNPSLTGEEAFGMAVHWGKFEHSEAIAAAAMGVVNRNVFGGGERLALTASIGISLREQSFGGRKPDNVSGGRVGVQLTW